MRWNRGFCDVAPKPRERVGGARPEGSISNQSAAPKNRRKGRADGGVIFADRQREQGRAAAEPRLPFDRDAFARFSTR